MKHLAPLGLLTALLLSAPLGAVEPLVTVHLKSYRAVIDDATRLSAAAAPDQPAAIEPMIQGMLGPAAMALIDAEKPWHLALWMDQMGQSPSGALYLPVADAPAFEAAIAQGFLATQALTVTDSGDFVIVTQSQTPDATLNQKATDYAQQLPAEPTDTLSVQLKMNEPVRMMAMGGLQFSKGMMLSSMQGELTPEMGLPADFYESIFGAYFGVLEFALRDLSTLNIALSVNEENLNYTVSIAPTAGTQLEHWMQQQNIEISDILPTVDWSSDMAIALSMAKLTDPERAAWSKLTAAMMPLYGLEAKDAEDWMQIFDQSLPLKASYSIEVENGFSFEGFYQLLDGSAQAVYDQSMQLVEQMPTAESNPTAYYSDIKFQKGIRTANGHSIDQISMTMNLDHPTMQMPGQKEQMLALFEDGKIVYESAVIDDRIYFAGSGELEQALQANHPKPAIQPTDATRMLGSLNLISLMKLGAQSAPEIAPMMQTMDASAGSLWCMLNISDTLEMQTIIPLQVLTEFSKMAPANPAAPHSHEPHAHEPHTDAPESATR